MHEQSETVTRPSGSVNVYGGTQFPLPKVFGFEKNYYPSQSEAVNAAQWRSRMGGGPEEYQDAPSYGFKDKPNTNPYAPIVGGAVDALQDPRMGMFPGAGLAGAGFRVAGMGSRMSSKLLPAMEKQISRRVESGALEKGQPYVAPDHALTVEMQKAKFPPWGMEGPPTPVQEATVMRQSQGDQSLARAAEEMRQSMGWTGEQLQQWMSKYRK